MCFISFIVPVYNLKESEVENCINSIRNQTFSDYEIIIVDDGSSNGIEEYCDSLAERYDINVIHQKNRGLAVARNTGMNASHGEWIVHIDGDDWVDVHLAEELKKKSTGSNADIIVWGFILDSGTTRQELLLKDKAAFNAPYSCIKDRILCSILDSDHSFASLSINTSWGKAYRRSFIDKNNLYYNSKLRRAQDAVYNLYAFSAASKVEYIDKALNFYRNDNISLSRGYNPKTFEYLQATAFATGDFCNANQVSENVRIATASFIQRCFRMINEQSYMHKDNKEPYAKKRLQFLRAIESEPFISAFAVNVTRDGLLEKIEDKLYIKKSFSGLIVYNRCFAIAYQIKKRIHKS